METVKEKKIVNIGEWKSFFMEKGGTLQPYNHYDDGYRDALDQIDDWLDAQPNLQNNAELVSVDERLPEYGTCLVVVKYKYDWEDHYNYDVDVAQLCYENDPYRIDGKWITFNDWDEGQEDIHITHWMPLPAPPKGVQ